MDMLDMIMWFARLFDWAEVFEDGSFIIFDMVGCIPNQLCE